MILAIKFLKMPHLLYINTITKHCVCFTRAGLTVCKNCTIKPLYQFRDAILDKMKNFRLFSISTIYNVILTFYGMSHILNSY